MTTTDTVQWEPPPPPPWRWTTRLEPLKSRPGEWARVAHGLYTTTDASNMKSYLSGGRATGVDPSEWEFKTGQIMPSSWGLWARYVGPPS